MLVYSYFLSFFFLMYVSVYMYTMCILGAQESQKRASDVLELELQTLVSCNVGAGNQT